jgi:hypothetical protein
VADFNQDGKPDVATWGGANADHTVYSIAVFLNTTPTGATTPTFDMPVLMPAGMPYYDADIRAADVTRDGIPDLIVVLHNAANARNLVGIIPGTTPAGATTATFAPPVILDLGASEATAAGPIAVADLDGDGAPDLVAAHDSSATVSLLRNTTAPGGTPEFADMPMQIGDTGIDSVAAQDVDGDGAPDLVVTTYRRESSDPLRDIGTIVIRHNAGGFMHEEHRDVSVNAYPGSIAIADFDRDGHADIAVALSGVAIDFSPW